MCPQVQIAATVHFFNVLLWLLILSLIRHNHSLRQHLLLLCLLQHGIPQHSLPWHLTHLAPFLLLRLNLCLSQPILQFLSLLFLDYSFRRFPHHQEVSAHLPFLYFFLEALES